MDFIAGLKTILMYLLAIAGIAIFAFFIYDEYTKQRKRKADNARMNRLNTQIAADRPEVLEKIVADCVAELDTLAQLPIFYSDMDSINYLKRSGLSKADVYDYVVNKGWTSKKYIYTLFMQMIQDEIKKLFPGASNKSNRERYAYLNEALFKDKLITYQEMERNEFILMEIIVKNNRH